MPLYTLSHSLPLSAPQRDQLAAAITEIHAEKFGAPSIFVNVKFEDLTAGGGEGWYVGGKLKLYWSLNGRKTNSLTAQVRTGPSRTQSDYDALTAELETAWDSIIEPSDHSQQLSPIFIFGSILAGRESGLVVPVAGKDGEWIRDNMPEFRRRAEAGEKEWAKTVKEVEMRGLGGDEKAEERNEGQLREVGSR